MSFYNTGIKDNVPSLLDLMSVGAAFVSDFVQVILGRVHTSFELATLEQSDPATYDSTTRSWIGAEGLHYRVPLYPIPSERHARERVRNVKILMDNCHRICVNDELPSTKAERQFWASYRFMKYQIFLAPACIVVPPLYVMFKLLHDRTPQWMRGRTLPILLGLAAAESIAEATYPAHQLLATALRARTPIGDAARAEWARLQSLDIPYYLFASYKYHHFLGTVPDEFLFGGSLAPLCT